MRFFGKKADTSQPSTATCAPQASQASASATRGHLRHYNNNLPNIRVYERLNRRPIRVPKLKRKKEKVKRIEWRMQEEDEKRKNIDKTGE